MRNFDLVLFDFDGTLADTLPLIYELFRDLFRRYEGKTMTDREIFNLFGPTEVGIVNANFSPENRERALTEMFRLYDGMHDRYVHPHPGILPMVEDLKKSGLQVAIFTGKSRPTFEISLKHLGYDTIFDYYLSGDDVFRTKPHPEGILKVAEMAGIPISRILYVGDSDHDRIATEAAGCVFAGAHWLPGGSNFKEKIPPLLFEDPSDLVRWIFKEGKSL